MSYTLAAAAAATGLNKTSILRAIKSGKVSGTKDEHGQWLVEPAELHRVYPPTAEQRCTPDAAQRDAVPNAAAIEARAVLAEQRLADLKAVLDDMRTDRDHWREQAQRLALPAPAPAMTWWRWLRSTG
jgi:hypothetical protein